MRTTRLADQDIIRKVTAERRSYGEGASSTKEKPPRGGTSNPIPDKSIRRGETRGRSFCDKPRNQRRQNQAPASPTSRARELRPSGRRWWPHYRMKEC